MDPSPRTKDGSTYALKLQCDADNGCLNVYVVNSADIVPGKSRRARSVRERTASRFWMCSNRRRHGHESRNGTLGDLDIDRDWLFRPGLCYRLLHVARRVRAFIENLDEDGPHAQN